MPRSGTLVICCQNLDFSGANQVILNIVAGAMHEGNVVVLTPKMGPFASRFVECGAAIRTGSLTDLLTSVRDVFCVICNTIMTAPQVVSMSGRPYPTIWILHEWWDDEMIKENLTMRNMEEMTISTVKRAMSEATQIVFVCEKQLQLYSPVAPSTVIFVGVPSPLPTIRGRKQPGEECPSPEIRPTFNFLVLGIICPRKNQVWAVELFKKFAQGRLDVRLLIVGARYCTVQHICYCLLVTPVI
jgi:glycosyltransferase involved in cell wall biosynthesis